MQNPNKHVQYTNKIARNTIVQYYEQYLVQNKTILGAIHNNTLCNKRAKILCKTVCNFEQYMDKTFVQSFLNVLLCKKVQYFVKKCNTGNAGNKSFYCTVLHILLNFVNNFGTAWFADADSRGTVCPATGLP